MRDLTAKLNDDKEGDSKEKKTAVSYLMAEDAKLRSKKKLIEQFINEYMVDLGGDDNISNSRWK